MSQNWMQANDPAEIRMQQLADETPEQRFAREKGEVQERSKIEADDHVAVGDGETPWWAPWMGEQATVLPGKMDVTEALNYSGLAGWNLTKVPMYHALAESGYGGGEYVRVPEFYAIRRQTDQKVLGVAKGRYRIIENETAFAWAQFLLGDEAVEKVTGEKEAGAYFTSAGSLRGGRVVFLVAKTPYDVDLPSPGAPEKLETYLLITNSHDGAGSVQCAIVTMRVVCQNTLDRSLNGSLGVVKIRHTINAGAKLSVAQQALGLARGASERARRAAEALMQKPAGNGIDRSKFLAALFPIPTEDVTKHMMTAIMKRREQVEDIYLNHPTLRNLDESAWRVYNAVTFYHDHATPRRQYSSADSSPEANRMDAIILGNNIGTRAYELLGGPTYQELVTA